MDEKKAYKASTLKKNYRQLRDVESGRNTFHQEMSTAVVYLFPNCQS